MIEPQFIYHIQWLDYLKYQSVPFSHVLSETSNVLTKYSRNLAHVPPKTIVTAVSLVYLS
jgi:hypothetical protein